MCQGEHIIPTEKNVCTGKQLCKGKPEAKAQSTIFYCNDTLSHPHKYRWG